MGEGKRRESYKENSKLVEHVKTIATHCRLA